MNGHVREQREEGGGARDGGGCERDGEEEGEGVGGHGDDKKEISEELRKAVEKEELQDDVIVKMEMKGMMERQEL